MRRSGEVRNAAFMRQRRVLSRALSLAFFRWGRQRPTAALQAALLAAVRVLPAQRDEAHRHRVQELALVKAVGDFRHWIVGSRELNALKQHLPARYRPQ